VVASFTRDVGAETAATRSSGGGYAGMKELTAGTHGQRERGSERGCGESGRTDGRAHRGRERRGKRRARGIGPAGPKGRGGQGCGLLSFFFYSGICFLFSFYLLYLIQIQISHNFKLAFLRIMHQTKVGFRV
jgi:hypothetical protein